MQRTKNYQLPQWEMNDRIMMKDFNDMTAKIDAGMAEAKSEGLRGQNMVAFGMYDGNNSSQTISVGFRPRAVLVCRQYTADTSSASAGLCSFFAGNGTENKLIFTDDGFMVYQGKVYPVVNFSGYKFFYAAFR